MNIIVCIKQVPDVKEVKWDPETGSLIRKGIPSIINPNDRNAIEAALQLREAHGGEVSVLSMGPSQVEEALREALAMGADRAVQLTDKGFAGSDTWATTYALGLAIRKMAPWDLVVCGKEAMDGMTAQVGPQLAEFLHVPQLTYAVSLNIVEGGRVRIRQKLGKLQRVLEASLPALVTVEREINEPRIAPMDTIMEAYEKDIPVWKPDGLDGDPGRFGLGGSPTRLRKVFSPKMLKGRVEILEGEPGEAAAGLVRVLREKFIL
ncbi:MAG: electron transfer flavoprotein subunit beta/FixA family protein [Deltaproteobacteria bacterium]|nr:electron transfer flavoprotein subunit beta/FixA family protein [Deltaproteobacteria bacterium]